MNCSKQLHSVAIYGTRHSPFILKPKLYIPSSRLILPSSVHIAHNTDEALIEIYNKLRPGEPATLEGANTLLYTRFFDAKRYDLARAGRFKLGKKLSLLDRITNRVLAQDVIDIDGNVVMKEGIY